MEKIKKFYNDESGTQVVETGLVLALISIAAIAAMTLVGTNATALYNAVAGYLVAP